MRWTIERAATALVALGVALAVLLPTGAGASSAPRHRRPPGPVVASGSSYVALGSSFAAWGVPPLTGGFCERSLDDYPQMVARDLKLALTDVTCFGATMSDVLNRSEGSQPPQIDAVGPSTSLVTLTVGGNDIDYVQTASSCAAQVDLGGCGSSVDRNRLRQLVSHLVPDLTATVVAIRERAPRATVVLVAYPRIVPPHPGSCPALSLTTRDASTVSQLGQALEQATVSVARSEHVSLADAYVLALGHGPCAPVALRWISGGAVRGERFLGNLAFHPTTAGRVEMARLVVRAVRR